MNSNDYREQLESMSDEELLGRDGIEEFRGGLIMAKLLERYFQLRDKPLDELYSEDEIEQLCDTRIEALCDAYEEELKTMDDEDLFGAMPEAWRNAEIERRLKAFEEEGQ